MAPDDVGGGLRQLWDNAGMQRRDLAVGLASQRVTARQLELPDLADPELADAVRLQAHDALPIPVEEAVLDFVAESHPVGDQRQNVRVLLVAAEREMVKRLLSAVTAAKLRPVLVDLDPFASCGAWRRAEDGPVAELAVDVGATVTKIAVHRGGRPLFVRMVRVGGDVVTRRIQDALALT